MVRCCEFKEEGDGGSGSTGDNDYNDYAVNPVIECFTNKSLIFVRSCFNIVPANTPRILPVP